MYNVGILTYHSAYNFGSAIQAYATQQTVNKIIGNSEIINYRLQEQDYFYQTYYRMKYGPKVLLKDLMMFPVVGKRSVRAKRFEDFFSNYFVLTDRLTEPEEVSALWNQYSILISGSDQIFSKKSHELRNNEWKYMDPYLLEGFNGKKISYASSIGGATAEDIQHIVPSLQKFDSLSFREESVAKKIEDILGEPIKVVLDPTFLLTKEEWIEKLKLRRVEDEKYILVYSLRNPQTVSKLIKPLKAMAKKMDCKVKMVTPFTYIPLLDSTFENHLEYGPREFLSALYNAECVVTDSYHGSILSVNFNKDFYSLCGNTTHELRKVDILERLGLRERVISNPNILLKQDYELIDYDRINAIISDMRSESVSYLKLCLSEEK